MDSVFVLDCSVTVAWCFSDEECVYSEKIIKRLAHNSRALVPFLWGLEVSNALLMSEKRKRINAVETLAFLERLDTLPITTSSFNPTKSELIRTARAYKLTPYDALYLMLAIHERIPLATKDSDLIKACDIVGVELLK